MIRFLIVFTLYLIVGHLLEVLLPAYFNSDEMKLPSNLFIKIIMMDTPLPM